MPDPTDFRFVLLPDPTDSGRFEVHFSEDAFMHACRLEDMPRVRSCTATSYDTTITHYECQATDALAVQERVVDTRAKAQAQADRCANIRRKAATLAGLDRPRSMTPRAALVYARTALAAAIESETCVRDCWAGHPARQVLDEQAAADHVADCRQRVAVAEARMRVAIEEACETLHGALSEFQRPAPWHPDEGRCVAA